MCSDCFKIICREEKPSQGFQLVSFFQSPGEKQREPVVKDRMVNRFFSGDFDGRMTREIVVIYDFAFFSYCFISSLGTKTVRFISLSLTKSGLNE